MKCLPQKSDKAAQKWACDKLNISTQSPSCSLVHHDQGHSKTLRGDISQVSPCWALRTWVTHVSWHNGPLSHWQRREVSKLRGILFWLRLAALYLSHLALMAPLFELMNDANSVFLCLSTRARWGCDQLYTSLSSHLFLISLGAMHPSASPAYPPWFFAPQLGHRFQLHHVFLHWVSKLYTHWQSAQALSFTLFSLDSLSILLILMVAFTITMTLHRKNVFRFIFKVPLQQQQ